MAGYFRDSRGYAGVPILGNPRQMKLYDYIRYVEENRYPYFTSVDESLIKRIAPYEDAFYWNYFHPAFAHYLTEFTKIMISMKVIKGYLPIIHGFRSPEFAASISGEGRKDAYWTPHRAGIAVDIACSNDIMRDRILAEADAFGFGGLGRGHGLAHIDIAGRGSWGYEDVEPYR